MERDLRSGTVTAEIVPAELTGRGEETELATRPNDELALGAVDGEAGAGLLRPAFLSVVYGTSKAVQRGFPVGGWALGTDTLVGKLGDVLKITILQASTFFREYLGSDAWKAGIQAQSFKTRKEVEKAGGTLVWDNSRVPAVPPTYSEAIALKVLIEKPKDLVSMDFGIDIDGKQYALARIIFDKTAAASVLPNYITAKDLNLRPPKRIYHGVFDLATSFRQKGKSEPKLAVGMRLSGLHTPTTIQVIEDLFGRVKIDEEIPLT